MNDNITYGTVPVSELQEIHEEMVRLKKYEELVQFIANDYHELSHDKAKWQRDDWKKRCRNLVTEDIIEEDYKGVEPDTDLDF